MASSPLIDALQKGGAAFCGLYQRFCRSLGFRGQVEAILQEMENSGRLPGRCCFARAFTAEEEGVQLSEDRAALGIGIRTDTLRDEGRCAFLLRHELAHVLDLLDPAFGHDETLPLSEASPAEELLFRDRYRTLWDLSVDGRLERKTKLPEGVRERRAAEFRALFPSLDEETVDRAAEQLLRRGVMNSPNVSERMISLARIRIYARLAASFSPWGRTNGIPRSGSQTKNPPRVQTERDVPCSGNFSSHR